MHKIPEVCFSSTFNMDRLAKISHHQCKKRLKIGKIARFESNLLKPNEDTVPQRGKILHKFVWWGTYN